MPAEALRPVTSLIRARISLAISVAIGRPCVLSVEIAFVRRQGFDQISVLGEDLPDLRGNGARGVQREGNSP